MAAHCCAAGAIEFDKESALSGGGEAALLMVQGFDEVDDGRVLPPHPNPSTHAHTAAEKEIQSTKKMLLGIPFFSNNV